MPVVDDAPNYETAQGILTETVAKFLDAMKQAENNGVRYDNLDYLVKLHTVKATYYQAAGLFAIAGAIQALNKSLMIDDFNETDS